MPRDRADLDRDRIVEAALGIVDTAGVEGLTMRRLARRLDCAPMSLYRHLQDKKELLALVVEAFAARMGAAVEPGGDWRALLTGTFGEIRQLLRDHPGIAAYLTDEAMLTPAALATLERALDALFRAGLDPQAAAEAFSALWTYTLGSVLVEQSMAAGQPGAPEAAEAHRRAVAAAAGRAGAAGHPRLAAAAPRWEELDADASFAAGLRLLLDGVAARSRG